MKSRDMSLHKCMHLHSCFYGSICSASAKQRLERSLVLCSVVEKLMDVAENIEESFLCVCMKSFLNISAVTRGQYKQQG